MNECIALFTWTHVYFYYFLYILLFISIFCVLPLPCFYACSFAGSNSQKPVGELCV